MLTIRHSGIWVALAAIMLICFVLNCGGSTSPDLQDNGTDDEDRAGSATITPQGGTVSFLGGDVMLTVPEGAVDTPVEITVTRLDADNADGAVPGALFEFEPDGLEFQEPVTLTVRYDTTRLPHGVIEEGLRLMVFTSGEPELLFGSLLDIDARRVSAQISGFSAYGAGVLADELMLDLIERALEAIADEDPEIDRHRDALEDDLNFMQPRYEDLCTSTNILAEKAIYFKQLVVMNELRLFFDFDGAIPVEDSYAQCGGLLLESEIVIEPDPILLQPGDQIQLNGTIFGPGNQELIGEIGWLMFDPNDWLSIDFESGLLTAYAPDNNAVHAQSFAFNEITGEVNVVVVEDLIVEIIPPELKIPSGRSGTLEVTVRDAESGDELEFVTTEWQVADSDLFRFVGSAQSHNVTVEAGNDRGTTEITACAENATDQEANFNEEFCASVSAESIFNAHGSWQFNSTLTVDVEPPATETCESTGTATFVQEGGTFAGTTTETETCTYDPGDGDDPVVDTATLQGEIRNGRINGDTFIFLTFYDDEACRTTGTLSGDTESSGLATSATGTTECEDEDEFYSVGATNGSRQ